MRRFPHASAQEALLSAERLRMAVEWQLCAPDSKPVTVSLGVTALRDRDTLDLMLERADKALYQAKGGGRNCVVGD